jgi:hypothetical protein
MRHRIGSEDVAIFKDMHQTRVITHQRDYQELLHMLSEAIARGYVEHANEGREAACDAGRSVLLG